MSKVLVTAGTGFIAGHCIEQLLKSGYDVITTVRSAEKGQNLLHAFSTITKGKLSYQIVENVGLDGAFNEVMKSTPDLTSVIHTASPFHLNIQDPIKDFLEPAIVGTTTVLKAAKDHGSLIKRVVVLSSFAAMRGGSKSNPEFYDESVWSPVTWEQAVQDRTQTYRGSKTLAEKAAWDFMEKEKPGFDLVAINPSLVFGPASLSLWSGSLSGVNTSNHRILDMVQGKMKDKIQPTGMFSWVDVRDVARAHVRALEVPEAGGKRFLLLAGYYSNKMIAEIIAELGPQYKARLPADLDAQDDLPKASERYNFSVERSTNLLGIAYTSLEKCIQDTVKSLEKLGS